MFDSVKSGHLKPAILLIITAAILTTTAIDETSGSNNNSTTNDTSSSIAQLESNTESQTHAIRKVDEKCQTPSINGITNTTPARQNCSLISRTNNHYEMLAGDYNSELDQGSSANFISHHLDWSKAGKKVDMTRTSGNKQATSASSTAIMTKRPPTKAGGAVASSTSKGQARRISIASFLPKSKRQNVPQRASNQTASSKSNNSQQQDQLTKAISKKQSRIQHHHHHLAQPIVFGPPSQIQNGPQMHLQHQHHLSYGNNANPTTFLVKFQSPDPMPLAQPLTQPPPPMYSFTRGLPGSQYVALTRNSSPLIGLRPVKGPQQVHFDQSMAQSMDNLQRIRYAEHPEEPAMYYATSSSGQEDDEHDDDRETAKRLQPLSGQLPNNNSHFHVPKQQQQQQAQSSQQRQKSQAQRNLAIGSAIAMALLGERGKSLISSTRQQHPAPQAIDASHQVLQLATAANASHPSRFPSTGSFNLASPNSIETELPRLIRNSAQMWTSSNIQPEATASNGIGFGAGAGGTIIVEDDGPSLTSVDFGPVPVPIQQPQVVETEPEDDEEESSFYSEESSEGSNEAKRIAKLFARPRHQPPRGQQHQGAELQRLVPVTATTGLRHYTHPSMPIDDFEDDPREDANIDGRPELYHRPGPRGVPARGDQYQGHLSRQYANNGHAGSYPDSISAVKVQQNNGDDQRGRGLRVQSHDDNNDSGDNDRNASDDDLKIERLIRELQQLKRKRDNINNNSAADRHQGRSTRSKSSVHSESSSSSSLRDEDFDDLLGSEDDEDDQQTKALRKKLLARLRNKRKRVEDHSEPDVRIPLHALLMAALERRMSPSERSKSNVLMSLNPFQTQSDRPLENTDTVAFDDQPTMLRPDQWAGASLEVAGVKDQNGTNQISPSPKMKEADFSITNVSLRNLTTPGDNNNNILDASQRTQYSSVWGARDHSTAPSTSAPRRAATSEDSPNKESRRTGKKIKWFKRSLSKPRRREYVSTTSNDEGDFDVNKQVDEFSQDSSEPSLDPAWNEDANQSSGEESQQIGSKDNNSNGATNYANKVKDNDKPAEFDQDFNEMDGAIKRKLLSRRRSSQPDGALRNPNKHEQDEDKFFGKLESDLVDINPSGIEDPIRSASEDEPTNAKTKPTSRAAKKLHQDDNDVDRALDDDHDEDESQDDPFTAERRARDKRRRRRRPRPNETTDSAASSKSGTSTSSSTTWRPQMVDDEVRKLERYAISIAPGQRSITHQEAPDSDEATDAENDDDDDDGKKQAEVVATRDDGSESAIRLIATASPIGFRLNNQTLG